MAARARASTAKYATVTGAALILESPCEIDNPISKPRVSLISQMSSCLFAPFTARNYTRRLFPRHCRVDPRDASLRLTEDEIESNRVVAGREKHRSGFRLSQSGRCRNKEYISNSLKRSRYRDRTGRILTGGRTKWTSQREPIRAELLHFFNHARTPTEAER